MIRPSIFDQTPSGITFRSRLRCRALAVVPMSSASLFSVILSCPVSSDSSWAAAMADLFMPRWAAEVGLSSGMMGRRCGSVATLFLALYIDLLIEGIDPFVFPVEGLGSLYVILHCLVIGLHQLKKPQFFSSVFRFVEPDGEPIALFEIKTIERPIFFLHFLEYFS